MITIKYGRACNGRRYTMRNRFKEPDETNYSIAALRRLLTLGRWHE